MPENQNQNQNQNPQRELMISIQGVKKQYKLGQIGGGTLRSDLESWWARKRGKEDPNTPLGMDQRLIGQTFMALNGVSFDVYKGEAVGIIGSNGAGKSTLLKLLTHVTAPTEGDIDIYGRVASMLEVGTGFHAEMTGRENVYMNGAILGMTRAEIDKKLPQIIEFSEVGDFIDTPVKRYSSGMYVKLAFSVAAHLDSEIMIMDEVLAVGDLQFQKKCLGKMGDEADGGRTILYVSHNMNTIRDLCTRCVVLKEGRVIFDGDVETGIALYSESQRNELQNVYELTDCKRPSVNHGRKIHIDRLRWTDETGGIFPRGGQMRFTLDWSAKAEIDNLYLRCIFLFKDNAHIGMAESVCLGSSKAGQSRSTTFTMDISMLPPGEYSFGMDMYERAAGGYHHSYDNVSFAIPFKVEETAADGLIWNHISYGHISFDPMQVQEAQPYGS